MAFRDRLLAKIRAARPVLEVSGVLADAAEACVASSDAARRLVAEGHLLQPSGEAFQPPKAVVFVTPASRPAPRADQRA